MIREAAAVVIAFGLIGAPAHAAEPYKCVIRWASIYAGNRVLDAPEAARRAIGSCRGETRVWAVEMVRRVRLEHNVQTAEDPEDARQAQAHFERHSLPVLIREVARLRKMRDVRGDWQPAESVPY
jgi:hypothetical protein